MDFGFFRERTPEQIFFGSLRDFSAEDIDKIVRLYLNDVIKYLFHKIPDDMRIIVPNEIPQVLTKLYDSEIIRYYQAGKYFVFESANREEQVELMNTLKTLFSSKFSLRHYKINMLATDYSTNRFRLTEKSQTFLNLLPFPEYILWAVEHTNRLHINEDTLTTWLTLNVKRINKIDIININEDILSYTILYENHNFEGSILNEE